MGLFSRCLRHRPALALAAIVALSVFPLLAQQQRQGPRYAVNPKALAAGCPGFAAPDLVGAPPQIDFGATASSTAEVARNSVLVVVGTVGDVARTAGRAGGAVAIVKFKTAIPLKADVGLALKSPLTVRAPGGFAIAAGKCVHEVDVGEWIEAGRNYLVFAGQLRDSHELWSSVWYQIGGQGTLVAVPFSQRAFLNGKHAADVETAVRAEALKEPKK